MKYFLLEKAEGIAYITINRPKSMNALNMEADIEFVQLLEQVGYDETTRVIVIRGAGTRAFCAGADLKERQQMNAEQKWTQVRHLQRVMEVIEELPVPVIAAIQGYCLGGGLELALGCDLRIASSTAVFHFPEMALGAFPGSGGPVRLCRLVSPAFAKEMLLTAKKIGGKEALRQGLINELVEDGQLEIRVESICREILKSTRGGAAAVKRIVNSIQNQDIKTSFALSNALRQGMESSKEYLDGIDRHFEKKAKQEPRIP